MESQYSLRRIQRDGGRHSTSPTSRHSPTFSSSSSPTPTPTPIPTPTGNSTTDTRDTGTVRNESCDNSPLVEITLDNAVSGSASVSVSVVGSGEEATQSGVESSVISPLKPEHTDCTTATANTETSDSSSNNTENIAQSIPSSNSSFSSGDMSVIEEKANRLLREGTINEEEHALILSNHLSAMSMTTIPLSPLPPPLSSPPSPPVNRSNATSSPPDASRLSRLSRRRFIAEQHAISTLTKAEAKKQKESKKRHQQITLNMEAWRNRILPRWEDCKSSSEVSRLVQKGIPTSLRGRIWCKMLQNKLQITPDIYQDHLEEALKMYDANGRLSLLTRPDDGDEEEEVETVKNLEDSKDIAKQSSDGEVDNVENPDEHINKAPNVMTGSGLSDSSVICQVVSSNDDVTSGDSFTEAHIKHCRNSVGASEKLELLVASMTLIQRDIPRTFPTLSFFHDDGPLASALDHVLKAYACYEPTIGYVQGMSYIAALLLLYMDEYETFVCFSNLLAIRTNRDFYMLEPAAITGYVKTFNQFFKQYLPLLYDHFEEEGITTTIFLLDWHLTIFTKALPLEIAARIWDCYLHCGEVYILRASLGLLRLFARRLSTLGMEKILPFLAHVPEEELSASELINSIEQIRISPEKYRNIRIQFDENLQRDSVNMGALAPDINASPNSFSLRKSIASMFT